MPIEVRQRANVRRGVIEVAPGSDTVGVLSSQLMGEGGSRSGSQQPGQSSSLGLDKVELLGMAIVGYSGRTASIACRCCQ
eukprot:11496325-Prorocentrum_lima.AAC.1